MKDKFIQLYEMYIKPREKEPGKLLKWLEQTDFFTAPASTRFHGNFPCGLLEHSLKVYTRLSAFNDILPYFDEDTNDSSIAIVALLHDLCKVNFYKKIFRNVKEYRDDGKLYDENGRFNWKSIIGYEVEDTWPMGHGEKSLEIVSRFIDLTNEEKLAIRWHMGFSDNSFKGGSYSVGTAMEMCPLIIYLNAADSLASTQDERIEK